MTKPKLNNKTNTNDTTIKRIEIEKQKKVLKSRVKKSLVAATTTTTTRSAKTKPDEVKYEPRQRRMASLNAQALVQIYSSSAAELNHMFASPVAAAVAKPVAAKRCSDDETIKHDDVKRTKLFSVDNDDVKEPLQDKNKANKIVKISKKTLKKTQEEKEAVNVPRPRREASSRASAMIIQTNEIEKSSRYKYTKSPPVLQPEPMTIKPQITIVQGIEEEEEDDEDVPSAPVKLKATKTKQSIKTQLKDLHAVTNTNNSSNSQNSTKQKSLTIATILNTKQNDETGVKIAQLTQENIAEHNKVTMQQQHNSKMSNPTCTADSRDYFIIKWVNEHEPPKNEKPFPVGEVSLEIFDYVKKSMKQSGANSVTMTITNTTSDTSTAKIDPLIDNTNVKKDQVLPDANTKSRQDDLHIHKSISAIQLCSSLFPHVQQLTGKTSNDCHPAIHTLEHNAQQQLENASAINRIAAAWNLSMHSQLAAVVAAASKFDHRTSSTTSNPYLPILSYQSQSLALPSQSQWDHTFNKQEIIKPTPLHIYQSPPPPPSTTNTSSTVNVIVKPKALSAYEKYYNETQTTSNGNNSASDSNNKLKITLNHHYHHYHDAVDQTANTDTSSIRLHKSLSAPSINLLTESQIMKKLKADNSTSKLANC